MIDQAKEPPAPSVDEVLKEIWRIKDEMSAARGHDLHRLFAEAREREQVSGREIVNFQDSKNSKIGRHAFDQADEASK